MTGRSILITGAASGIGAATALAMTTRDSKSRLFLTDRDEKGLSDTATRCRDAGAQVATMVGDLADSALPSRLVEAALASYGTLDTVISNAGTTRRGDLVEQNLDNWDYVFAVNARATWLLAQAAFAALRASKGSLVAVASIAGTDANPGTGFYSASKAALLSLVSQLALEWSLHGVRVNAVSPGATLTGLNAANYANDPALKQRREALIPAARFATPDEIAGAILFIASDAARFCQGHNLIVDGGLTPAVLAHALPPIAKRTPSSP